MRDLVSSENMEYQLVCYNGMPLAEAPAGSAYRDMVLTLIQAQDPKDAVRRRSYNGAGVSLVDNVRLHLDVRRPIACAVVCQTGTFGHEVMSIKDAYYVLEIMHSRVSSLFPPSQPFEHQHTLGILLPQLAPGLTRQAAQVRRSDSADKLCMQADLSDSLQSDHSTFGSTPNLEEGRGVCAPICEGGVWYAAAWLAAVFMACVVIFLGVAAWIYFRDYF
jgi:hypothetical protein